MIKITSAVRRDIILVIQRHPAEVLLTWAIVREHSSHIVAGGISRVSMSKDEAIAAAFDKKKAAFRGQGGREPKTELDKARQRIKEQNAIINDLKKKIAEYDQQLATYVINALAPGRITMDQLMRPIPLEC